MPTHPAPHGERPHARGRLNQPSPDTAADFPTIAAAREAARSCRRCPLWHDATQTVFGEGPDHPEIVFVGEQPGDQEDIAGRPFVGPAGRLLDAALDDAGIDRAKVYVTNAVKHFKFEPRGKRRIHSKPNAGEIRACRWWLEKELALTVPKLVVALGATAAHALLGEVVSVTQLRGQTVYRSDGLRVFVTIHPSFILRLPEEVDKRAERARFLEDMRAVARMMV